MSNLRLNQIYEIHRDAGEDKVWIQYRRVTQCITPDGKTVPVKGEKKFALFVVSADPRCRWQLSLVLLPPLCGHHVATNVQILKEGQTVKACFDAAVAHEVTLFNKVRRRGSD